MTTNITTERFIELIDELCLGGVTENEISTELGDCSKPNPNWREVAKHEIEEVEGTTLHIWHGVQGHKGQPRCTMICTQVSPEQFLLAII